MKNRVIFHLKITKENTKGAEAMDAVLNSLNEVFRKQPIIFSWEIVAKAGFLYFFVVGEREGMDTLKGQLFSQYPSLQVEEISDYITALPDTTLITKIKLKNSDAYPLKTYKKIGGDCHFPLRSPF